MTKQNANKWAAIAIAVIVVGVIVLIPRGGPDEDMVVVPAGQFEMGSNVDIALEECRETSIIAAIAAQSQSSGDPTAEWGDCRRSLFADEEPVHSVTLDAYYIDRFEVTNSSYAECVAAGACDAPIQNTSFDGAIYFGHEQYDEYPVIWVSWQRAFDYCQWRGARLPTEAEWEKAARGEDGRKYPWGDGEVAGHLLNYADQNSEVEWADTAQDDGYWLTAPVGSFPEGASPYGALDMAGNVWEWVADWHDESYYANSPPENPPGPSTGELRVARGGSWIDNDRLLRAAGRFRGNPTGGGFNVGFRCARSR